MDAKAIADGTLAAIDRGKYRAPDDSVVAIRALVDACVRDTRCYTPEELAGIYQQVVAQSSSPSVPVVQITVSGQTALASCADLSTAGYGRVAVLNFASARNPGGGFLRGARAQEETLARSSALYLSLRECPDFYSFHRAQQTCLYSDRMIYSPACPVLRGDSGNWLARPYLVDFITSPAPNAGAILRNEPGNRERIVPTLRERAGKVLALAAHHQCDALVLGAWGCGVFQNDPATVAAIFADYLREGGVFHGRFRRVQFAVYDRSLAQETLAAFITHCGNLR